ncbi:hypothetical protein GH733_017499 [Mirounga leonina]|nr:hypothetical protein GH733_017499 [Mirounga leonina]
MDGGAQEEVMEASLQPRRPPVSNVISALTYGRRFEYDDRPLPPAAGTTAGGSGGGPGLPARDLTDAFLDEVEKAKGSPESSFNDENLGMMTSDLFAAGIVSTSATLTWALLLMILHPDEIDEVIGRVQGPEMGDQTHMPFTMAVVHEVQRFGDIIPLGLLHITSRDTEVQGFPVPKGTRLITHPSSVLKDEKVWKKAFRFHPEHFLDAQGRFVKQEAFVPFSAGAPPDPPTGRRICLGEPLARMELFLFFTCLLQRLASPCLPDSPGPATTGSSPSW